MGHLLQFVFVLGDQHTIVQRLFFRQLRMGMSADDKVEPWIGLCHLYISVVAEMRQQDCGITLTAEIFILTYNILRKCEPDDANFDTIDIEDLGGYDVQPGLF